MLQNAKKPISKCEAIANSSVKSAFNLQSPVILAETDIGRLTRMISKYRPFSQVVVICRNERLANSCCLARSCNGLLIEQDKYDVNQLIRSVVCMLINAGNIQKDQDIVFVSGVMDATIKSQFQMKLIQA